MSMIIPQPAHTSHGFSSPRGLGSGEAVPPPEPRVKITTRLATMEDLPFMDALQKAHTRAVGYFPRGQFEGYIRMEAVLIAERHEGTEARRHEVPEEERREVPEGAAAPSSASGPFVPSCLRASVPSARASVPSPVGYIISRDRYLKRDELGIVYQLLVTPGAQRGYIGAALLKAAFERSAYGCRLYCCWCAQDLPANKFWESMGFVPLAFRAGSAKKKVRRHAGTKARRHEVAEAGAPSSVSGPFVPSCLSAGEAGARASVPSGRVHIFWQKRINPGDDTTPWWYPFQTNAGAIRQDRLVFPIPPGTHWSEVEAVAVPVVGRHEGTRGGSASAEARRHEGEEKGGEPTGSAGGSPKRSRKKASADPNSGTSCLRASVPSCPPNKVAICVGGKVRYIERPANASPFPAPPPPPPAPPAPVAGSPAPATIDAPAPVAPAVAPETTAIVVKKPRPAPPKIDPAFLAANRELRDVYLEHLNADPAVLPALGKYDAVRALTAPTALRQRTLAPAPMQALPETAVAA